MFNQVKVLICYEKLKQPHCQDHGGTIWISVSVLSPPRGSCFFNYYLIVFTFKYCYNYSKQLLIYFENGDLYFVLLWKILWFDSNIDRSDEALEIRGIFVDWYFYNILYTIISWIHSNPSLSLRWNTIYINQEYIINPLLKVRNELLLKWRYLFN